MVNAAYIFILLLSVLMLPVVGKTLRFHGKVCSDSPLYRHPEDYDNEIRKEEIMEFLNVTEVFSCDACDKSFFDEAEYDVHMSQHKICNLDGCKFSAHEKIIELHVRLQHSTGLYDKIRNINTSEDINKWIEERKRKYPNTENIEKRYLKQEEQLKRGERIFKKPERFSQNKCTLLERKMKKKMNHKLKIKRKKPFPPKKKEKSLIDDSNVWNNMIPFKGTSALYTEDVEIDEGKYEDEEWIPSISNKVINLNNALGALMGAYMSDSDSDEIVSSIRKDKHAILQKPFKDRENGNTINDECVFVETNKSDDEPPTEMKIEKMICSEPQDFNKSIMNKLVEKERNIKYKKDKSNALNKSFVFHLKKQRKSLLEKLLESDIRAERNILLQCIRYIINKTYFKAQ